MDQPTLFDAPAGPPLVGTWWAVDLGEDVDGGRSIHGPFVTRAAAETALSHARARYGMDGHIVTCRTTAWEVA